MCYAFTAARLLDVVPAGDALLVMGVALEVPAAFFVGGFTFSLVAVFCLVGCFFALLTAAAFFAVAVFRDVGVFFAADTVFFVVAFFSAAPGLASFFSFLSVATFFSGFDNLTVPDKPV